MKKPLPIGNDNFEEVIRDNSYYVDKTNVIEELVNNNSKIVLFPRPRRFGKSLFISMLENFFDIEKKEKNQNLFEGLNISKSSVYIKNLNKYPVISLDFKDLKYDNFDSLLYNFKSIMANIFIKKEYIYDSLKNGEKEIFDHIENRNASLDEYRESIINLSSWLERYYNEKTIILIDEYDTPIEAGRNYGYYRDVMNLIQPLFSKAFKGNDSLKMGVLTGVLRVGGESLFSSFNNLNVYDVMTPGYNEYFGFTEKETKELLEYYDLQLTDEVKKFYDGYNFNGIHIYNPWSIINYADKKMLTSYWVNTGSNTLIKDMLSEINEDEKMEIEKLVLGTSINFEYEPKLSYNTLMSGLGFNSVLNLMLISGYLTVDYIEDEKYYYKIPNREVRKDFGNMLESILFNQDARARVDLKNFIQSLKDNNKAFAEENLNKIIASISYNDNSEKFYHGYLLGLLNSFINDNTFVIASNPEAGYGRTDIIIKKKDNSLGIVLEFKVSSKMKYMEQDARKAMDQIKSRNYRQILETEGIENIYEYVIVFHGKRAIVR